MGQYHRIYNLDKKEFLHPHSFGDALKMMEFGAPVSGTLLGLTILLASSHRRGGGDFRGESALLGSWAGHRIAIIGDYSDPDDIEDIDALAVYNDETYNDISLQVVDVLRKAGELHRAY